MQPDNPRHEPTDGVRRATLAEVAQMHDEQAAYWASIRDPGMANHHRAWAKKMRDMGGIEPPAPPSDRSAIPFNVKRLGRRT
jgi:hypothetical protein